VPRLEELGGVFICSLLRYCMSLFYLIVGRKYKSWIVLRYLGSLNGRRTYLCRCECGAEKEVRAADIGHGRSVACRKCTVPHEVEIAVILPQTWWRRFQRQARKRKIKWELREHEVLNLFQTQNGQCALTGIKLHFDPMTASIDRISSDGCYTLKNIQWVHKHINLMKYSFENEYFIEMCRSVAEHNAIAIT